MHPQYSLAARLLGRYAVALIVLTVVLAWTRPQWQGAGAPAAAPLALAATDGASAEDDRARLTSLARSNAARVATLSVAQLNERIATLRRSLLQDAARPSLLSMPLHGTAQITERLAERYRRALRLEIGRQELDHLLRVRAWVDSATSRDDVLRQRDQLRAEYLRTYQIYQQLQQAQQQMRTIERLRMSVLARTTLADQRRALASALQAFNEAAEAFEATQSVVRHIDQLEQAPPFVLDETAIEAVTGALAIRLEQVRAVTAARPLARLGPPLLAQLPLALAILLAACAVRALLKLLLLLLLPFRLRAALPSRLA